MLKWAFCVDTDGPTGVRAYFSYSVAGLLIIINTKKVNEWFNDLWRNENKVWWIIMKRHYEWNQHIFSLNIFVYWIWTYIISIRIYFPQRLQILYFSLDTNYLVLNSNKNMTRWKRKRQWMINWCIPQSYDLNKFPRL